MRALSIDTYLFICVLFIHDPPIENKNKREKHKSISITTTVQIRCQLKMAMGAKTTGYSTGQLNAIESR